MKKNIIRELREKENITQRDLAKMLGVSSPVVSAWERTEEIPREIYIPLLCSIFNVDEEEIISRYQLCEKDECRKNVYEDGLCFFHFNKERKKVLPPENPIIPQLEKASTIGERLSILKRNNGFTDEYIAKELGVTQDTLRAWENNSITPRLLMIIDIASFYGINSRLLERGNPESGEDDLCE